MTLEELESRLGRAELELVRLDERLITSMKDRQQLHEDISAMRKAIEEYTRCFQAGLDNLTAKVDSTVTALNEKVIAMQLNVTTKVADVNTNLRVLETRVGIYAGLGGLLGGAIVTLIVYVIERLIIPAH